MKKCLTRTDQCVYYYVNGDRIYGVPDGITGNLTGIWGNLTGITGDLTGITGDLTEITGNLTGIWGDIDDAGLTDDDRKRGVSVDDLLMDEEIGGSDGKEI